jgi:DNA-binding LytR/AlgR family response regulator
MKKVKILVVEDEIIIADNICDVLENLGYEVTEPAINYTEALILIEQEKPDIAILDIQLSGKKTGIDIAKKIRKCYNFPFIFLTSNSDSLTVNQAKEVSPPAFLIKPFTKEELYTSIEIAISNFSKNKVIENERISEKSFFVKNKGVYIKVHLKDVLYIKSSHVYVEVFLVDGKKIIVRKSLHEISLNLDETFIQVHRSYIINIEFIKEIESSFVNIIGEEIPLSKKYRDTLFKQLKL